MTEFPATGRAEATHCRCLCKVAAISIVASMGGPIATSIAAPEKAAESGVSKGHDELKPEDWLLRATNDRERFRLLQQQLRGFDVPMWEVGERWQRLHAALERGNYDLALFHWWKIEQTISYAIVRRPAKEANARAFLLDKNYARIRAEFESRDARRAWAAFEEAKGLCQGCHVAEQVAFANDQALFDLGPPAR